jgi:hypothetical protein
MTEKEDETKWRGEFERDGERAVHDTIYRGPGVYPEPKQQAALRWLREQESNLSENGRCTSTCAGRYGPPSVR